MVGLGLEFTCKRKDLPFLGFLVMVSIYSSLKGMSFGLQVGFWVLLGQLLPTTAAVPKQPLNRI